MVLFKVEGKFNGLPIRSSKEVQLGQSVVTVGFPNIDIQGFSPKLSKGEIAGLSGIQDDSRNFQISNPIQPGNSGGALVDQYGNVVGVIVAKLNQQVAVEFTGTIAENVNYAIKSSYLLSFLESVPQLTDKLKKPSNRKREFSEVVDDLSNATAIVLVY